MKLNYNCGILTVKSVVTIALVIVFCILSITGKVTAEQFMTVFVTVISFYYGTQHGKFTKDTNEVGKLKQTINSLYGTHYDTDTLTEKKEDKK